MVEFIDDEGFYLLYRQIQVTLKDFRWKVEHQGIWCALSYYSISWTVV